MQVRAAVRRARARLPGLRAAGPEQVIGSRVAARPLRCFSARPDARYGHPKSGRAAARRRGQATSALASPAPSPVTGH